MGRKSKKKNKRKRKPPPPQPQRLPLARPPPDEPEPVPAPPAPPVPAAMPSPQAPSSTHAPLLSAWQRPSSQPTLQVRRAPDRHPQRQSEKSQPQRDRNSAAGRQQLQPSMFSQKDFSVSTCIACDNKYNYYTYMCR